MSNQSLAEAAPIESLPLAAESVVAPGAHVAATMSLARRPFYAIAHRILKDYGVRSALAHGAKAIEVDMTAWSSGWWADYDGLPTNAGDTQRRCSRPFQKSVLYGFYKSMIGKRAYHSISKGLNANEALDVDGEVAMVEKELHNLRRGQRVYPNGFFGLAMTFEPPLASLKAASKIGAFGKVFGWTLANHNDKTKVARLVNGAKVDGLIYDFKHTHYYGHADKRGALNDIIRTIWAGSRYRLANINDDP
ncbi:unnamed protein product [Clonostachys rhizophaga]|uniref:Uncharacterized protein n=1 Tax=Clonostachys rhizophaga TaxID=160324 RepID=A0A9N9VLY6_9HYPO|nr:unnamed protein product [Clonostachys rhizophaga]